MYHAILVGVRVLNIMLTTPNFGVHELLDTILPTRPNSIPKTPSASSLPATYQLSILEHGLMHLHTVSGVQPPLLPKYFVQALQ